MHYLDECVWRTLLPFFERVGKENVLLTWLSTSALWQYSGMIKTLTLLRRVKILQTFRKHDKLSAFGHCSCFPFIRNLRYFRLVQKDPNKRDVPFTLTQLTKVRFCTIPSSLAAVPCWGHQLKEIGSLQEWEVKSTIHENIKMKVIHPHFWRAVEAVVF